MSRLTSLVRGVAWLAIVVVIGVAGAGLVVALDHPAGELRPELTWRGDAAVERHRPVLRDLADRLAAAVGDASTSARDATSALRRLEPRAARSAVNAGGSRVTAAVTAAADLAAARDALLTDLGSAPLSVTNRERLVGIEDAIASARAMPQAWQRLSDAVGPAARVLESRERHGSAVFDATEAARAGRWEDALGALDRASTELRAIEPHVDPATTPVLDEWLARSRAHTDALRRLYTLLRDSGGAPTPASGRAEEEVAAAQRALPAREDVAGVIGREVSEPALSEALVALERIRGSTRALVVALD